jgi:hypothetical protein
VLVFDIGQSARSADVSEVWRAVSADSRCTLAAGCSPSPAERLHQEEAIVAKPVLEPGDELHERELQVMEQAVDCILDIIRIHEDRRHGGVCCINERVNAVAFIAHQLGLAADDDNVWEFARAIIKAFYEPNHH